MKLRELFSIITKVQSENNISPVFVTGGIARDKVQDKFNGTHLLKNINDIDLTTGDNSIHSLAKNLGIELGKSYSIKTRELDDGHSSIFLGKLKIDCSSNFILPGIEQALKAKGIVSPSGLDKEMWSRDFTFNSLLLSLDMETIKDPTKLGVQDIKNKILRTNLDPNITLKYNLNRIPRVFYLAAKLGFSVEPEIIQWISQNKELIHQIKPGYLAKTMEKAFHYNANTTKQLLEQTGLQSIIKSGQLVFKRNRDYGEADDSVGDDWPKPIREEPDKEETKTNITRSGLPPEIVKKFQALAHAQRGAPEEAMQQASIYMGGGILPVMLEHIGDLTHRMTNNIEYGYTGYGEVKEKVVRALKYLDHPYGFQKEMKENFENNAKYRNIPFDEYMSNVKRLLDEYVRAHKALPTYNKAQKYANWAAIAIGKLDSREASMWISFLSNMLSSPEEWKKHVWDYDGKPLEEKKASVKTQEDNDPDEKELLIPPNKDQKVQAIGEKVNWIVDMDPKTFLLLTLEDRQGYYPRLDTIEPEPVSLYMSPEVQNNLRVHPYLSIDKTTGKVVGHEGRHRAAAVMKAGGKWYRVGIRFIGEYGGSRNFRPEQMPTVWKAQFTGFSVNVSDLIAQGKMRVIDQHVQKDYYKKDAKKANMTWRKIAYFAGNENYGDEYYPGDAFYYPSQIDNKDAVGEDTLSEGNKDRTNSIPAELKNFRKNRKKVMKRVKLRKILEDAGAELPDEDSDKAVLEGHPYTDDAFNQGVSGLFSYPLSYTGTIADNPNTMVDEYSKIYQRTD